MRASILALALFAAWAAGAGGALAQETAVTLSARPGASESFVFDRPADAPRAAVILLPGGEGMIGVHVAKGQAVIDRPGNFLIRSRARFVAHGFAVAALDSPSDDTSMSESFRMGAAHASDIGAVADWLRAKTGVPVWLVGTSMGSISAASAAIRLGSRVDGVVLTSSVSASGRNSPAGGVLALDLGKIGIPVLVMAHANDACPSSPPGNAQTIAERLSGSHRVAVRFISGGGPPKGPVCEPFGFHGYVGVEDQAVAAIADFILAK